MKKTQDIHELVKVTAELVKDYQYGYITYNEYKQKVSEVFEKIKNIQEDK